MLVVLPLLVLWWWLAANEMSYIRGDYVGNKWNYDFRNTSNNRKYNVVIIGDSIANCAYLPELLSENTVHLSLSGSSVIEQYYILNDYLKHNEPPKVIYISFHDNHFNRDNGWEPITLFMNELSVSNQINIINDVKMYKETSMETKGRFDWILYNVHFPSKYLTSFVAASANGRKNANKEEYKKDGFHRGKHVGISIREFFKTGSEVCESFTIKPIFLDYYERIFELCHKYDIPIRVIKVPSCRTRYSDKYKKEYNSFYYNENLKYHVLAFDWIDSAEFSGEDFADNIHMNIHGALKFTEMIKKMHPEDFDDASDTPISRGTIEGISDYLRIENRPADVLKWIDGKNFSVAIFTRNNGDIQKDDELMRTLMERYPSALSSMIKMDSGEQCLYVTGDNHEASVSYSDAETLRGVNAKAGYPLIGGFVIKDDALGVVTLATDGYEIQALTSWDNKVQTVAPGHHTDMCMVIFNCYDKKVVAVKNFALSYGKYELMK